MTNNDLLQIKESIERIERFPIGYPKLIEDVDERWRPFFLWQFRECVSQAKKSGGDNLVSQPLFDI